jgi:hypothetical protein
MFKISSITMKERISKLPTKCWTKSWILTMVKLARIDQHKAQKQEGIKMGTKVLENRDRKWLIISWTVLDRAILIISIKIKTGA